MTRAKFTIAAALLAAGLLVSLSVYALSDGEEPQSATLDEIDVEEIQDQVQRALESVQWQEIGGRLADVQSVLDGIDPEAIRAQVEAAMAELDIEAIHAEVKESLEEVDWEEIRRDIEAAHAEIETLDLEGVRIDVLEALEDIDWDEIRQTLEDAREISADELEALDEMLEDLGVGSSGVI